MNPNLADEDARDDSIRQLSFDQENSWSPTVGNDGKIFFTRWEYTDNSHYFSRILMKMNPDGSGQMAHYGSTSYWPNSLFYCRQLPEDSNKFIGIVSGHHGECRSGELHLFDISKGVIEDQGRTHQYLRAGETQSCIGCHEPANTAPVLNATMAAKKAPKFKTLGAFFIEGFNPH